MLQTSSSCDLPQMISDSVQETLSRYATESSERRLSASRLAEAATRVLQKIAHDAHNIGSITSYMQSQGGISVLAQTDVAYTNLNFGRWYKTTYHAATLLVEVINGPKRSWTKKQFSSELARKYSQYNDTVQRLAWRILPTEYKNGVGRPPRR